MKKTKTKFFLFSAIALFSLVGCNSIMDESSLQESQETPEVNFVVTETLQSKTYDDAGNEIDNPLPGESFYGQDSQYEGITPSYTDNGDGTVTDNNTGLMWTKSPADNKMFYDDAVEYVENLETGGYTDWRLPTIQESFSLAMLDGKLNPQDTSSSVPYIDNTYFEFSYDQGKPYTGSYWTSSTTVKMEDLGDTDETAEKNYGFNWADGHLKSYADGYTVSGESTGHSIPAGVRAVRGEEGIFGTNDYVDNQDGTITDNATGLMWTKEDAEEGMDWETALKYVEEKNDENYLGYNDWRMPNAKELQSIVEYGKATIPAVDTDYFSFHEADCYVWTNTTSGDFPQMADYVTFGHGWGIEIEQGSTNATIDDFSDVHGPGCIRADYKSGTAPYTSQQFYEKISQGEYPGTNLEEEATSLEICGSEVEDNNNDGVINEFDLTYSENAANYIVIYNRVMMVRDAD